MSTDVNQPVNSQDPLAATRRANLRKLMAEHTASKLSTMLGYKQSSFLSQMAGPNPTREVTEKTVRAFEKQLGLPAGAMDKPLGDLAAPAQLTSAETIALMLTVTRTVGKVCEAEAVSLPPGKFANVLEMSLLDALERDNQVRETYIKQVVALVK